MNTEYMRFLASKRIDDRPTGLAIDSVSNPMLFDFQADITRWALRRGRAAIFADCGLGKTPIQLEWARRIPGRVIIAAPLAVATQTVREADKFGVEGVRYLRADDHSTRIVVTNYEMLDRFRPRDFVGIVLDESSILKSYTGKFRNQLIADWGCLPFRLAATATPAPNDFMELGNHSEFIGAMTRTDMLASFFVHDGGETQKWRLKGHAESEFWRWMCSWAVMIRKPSDLGYNDGAFILPGLKINQVQVESNSTGPGMLFPVNARTLQERREARKMSVGARVAAVAGLVNSSDRPWITWCDLNIESGMLAKEIHGAVEIRGSDDPDFKEDSLIRFASGDIRVLVTKPSIAGFGLNWQHCSDVAFTGLSDSYEQFYQAIRRCWRFGQKRAVECHVVTSTSEGAVVENIKRKEAASERMADMMVRHMQGLSSDAIRGTQLVDRSYDATEEMEVPDFL